MKKYVRPDEAIICQPLEVTLRPGESVDSLIKRFKTKVRKSDTMLQLRSRRFYRTKAEMRRKKAEIRRHLTSR